MLSSLLALLLSVPFQETPLPKNELDLPKVLDDAKEAYSAQKYERAIELLQQAIAHMQSLSARGWSRFFPVVEGWIPGEIEDQSANTGAITGESMQIVQLSRRYGRGEESKESVQITITQSKQLVAATRQMAKTFNDPQMLKMMNADPDRQFKALDEKGWSGYTMVSKKEESSQIFALCGSTLITIQSFFGPADTSQKFWSLMKVAEMSEQAKKNETPGDK